MHSFKVAGKQNGRFPMLASVTKSAWSIEDDNINRRDISGSQVSLKQHVSNLNITSKVTSTFF